MDYVRIAAFVFPLGLDTLALAVALGLRGIKPLRPAVVFAVFEGVMPLAGVALGSLISAAFGVAALYIGAAILIGLGVHSIREAGEIAENAARFNFASLRSAALAGFAISTDELAFGFPLGSSGLPVAPVLLLVALQAFIVSYAGIALGRWLGARCSRLAELAAGVTFIALGVYLVLDTLLLGP